MNYIAMLVSFCNCMCSQNLYAIDLVRIANGICDQTTAENRVMEYHDDVKLTDIELLSKLSGYDYRFTFSGKEETFSSTEMVEYMRRYVKENQLQASLARFFGVESSTIRKWLTGDSWELNRLCKIAQILELGNIDMICTMNHNAKYDVDPISYAKAHVAQKFNFAKLDNLEYKRGYLRIIESDWFCSHQRIKTTSEKLSSIYMTLRGDDEYRLTLMGKLINPVRPISPLILGQWMKIDSPKVPNAILKHIDEIYVRRSKIIISNRAGNAICDENGVVVNAFAGTRGRGTASHINEKSHPGLLVSFSSKITIPKDIAEYKN